MKTKVFFLLLLLACLMPFSLIFGQSSQFTRVFYDNWISAQGYGIVTTIDGRFVMAGVRDNRAMVAAVNDSGALIWMKQSLTDHSRFQCIANTHDNAVLSAGYIVGLTSGKEALLLLKSDPNGDPVFTRVFETADASIVQSIQPTPDHGFILCGWQDIEISPFRALFVAKADSAGHIAWFRRYHSFYATAGFSARPAADGGFIVAGRAPGSTPFQESALFMKLSASGDVIWSKDVQTGTGSHMNCNDIAETPDGLLLLVNSSNYDLYMVSTDDAGNFQGSKRLNQFIPSWEEMYPRPKMKPISGNRFVFSTPSWGGDDRLLVVDQTGNPVYENSLQMITSDVALRPDQGFMVLGNGPIMGVMMANTNNPQIGLMATDSTGVTVSCAYQQMPFSTNNVLITTDYPINSSPVAVSEVSPPSMEPTTLSFWDGCVAITGAINGETNTDISAVVSPNPNAGQFTITLQGATSMNGKLEISNVQGKQVYYSPFDSKSPHDVDLSGAAGGIYFISIMTEKGIFRKKTVISKPRGL